MQHLDTVTRVQLLRAAGEQEQRMEIERLREALSPCALDRHTKLLHNADFEVCDDWLCKAARAALGEGK